MGKKLLKNFVLLEVLDKEIILFLSYRFVLCMESLTLLISPCIIKIIKIGYHLSMPGRDQNANQINDAWKVFRV